MTDGPPGGALPDDPAYLRMLLDNTADVVVHTVDGVVQWISPSVHDLLGYAPSELVGRTTTELWHPADLEATVALRDAAYAGRLGRDTLRMRHRDGHYVWVAVRIRPRATTDGVAVASLRDVTTEHDALQALEISEERFRLLAENASDVVWTADAEGRITWVSPSVTAVLGWDVDDVIGSVTIEFVADEDRDRATASSTDVTGGAPLINGEFRFRTATGTTKWMAVRARRVHSDLHTATARAVSLRDITVQVEATQALAASESRFRMLAENASDTVWAVDADGVIRWSSPSVRTLLGWTVEEVTGTNSFDWVMRDDRDRALSVRAEVRRSGHAAVGEVRFRTADGGTRWVAATSRPVSGDDPSLVRAVTLRDIDAEIAARHAVAEHVAQLRVILDSSPDEITRIDDEGRIDFVNARVVERTSRPTVAWIGRRIDELAPTDTFAAALRVHVATVVDTATPLDVELQTAEADATRWYQVRLAPECGPLRSVHHVVLQIRDVTDRKAAETDLITAAFHDSLTGLANRVAVADEITHALGAGRRARRATGVLLIDLDHFKFINDSLGHTVGDDLIRAAAERITRVTRAGDVVGRQGGDEFVVVMRDLDDPTEAVHAAERLVAAFRRPLSIGDAELFSTASIGVTVADPDGRDAGDLLREADTAMYAAKNAGRDRLSVFNEDLRRAVSERLRIENELRAPVERGELSLWYQPEIDLRSGDLRAVEALLRWHHPSGELYTADRFIDVAEESGLILGIGEWVIRRACEQSAAWARRRGTPLTVRLNLSAVQLSEPSLVDTLDDAIAQSGAQPAALCLEITESALMRDVATVRRNLEQIRARHIKIAIDDFGTGYASLTYLRQFPVDVLKIDRSFVAQITSADFDRRLVAGVIALSHSLDIPVTAEGVETDEQATMLRGFGCEGAQGWLFSGAVPADEIDELLAAG